jgi:hypothetical protein
MTKSRAYDMADDYFLKTDYDEFTESGSFYSDEALIEAFLAGMKAMLKEALTYCSSWDGGDSAGTHDANDLYEHLKKLMEQDG